MSRARSYVHEWLELVERSGLLVSEPVLHRFFPSGPEPVENRRQRTLLGAWERFQVEPDDSPRQSAWLDAVFELLEWPEGALLRGQRLPDDASVHLPELDQWLRPHGVLQDPDGRILLGLWRVPPSQGFDRVERLEGSWRATPHMKIERWLRRSRNPFGLLTNGAAFRLVYAPPELPGSWIEFPASLFFEEKSVLDGFFTLLSAGRFLGPAESRLERFAEESQKTQAELTDSLGEQVRNAVETLILALDRADRGRGGLILSGLDPDEIYKAAVYAVMRLVFILFAEERNLLPHGNVFFDEGYGLGRLLHLLEDEKRTRPEAFESENDAWPRLLALFRVIFHGSGHPDLTLPAYGGDLFSPQGFPAVAALEHPFLRLANQDVYEILRALTFGEARVGRDRIAQRYSYRNLDVEHIGYLYEGLLDHRVARAGREPLVKLANGTETAIPLAELEKRSGPELIDFLEDHKVFGGDRDRIARRLIEPEENLASIGKITVVDELGQRLRPFVGVIQPHGIVRPGRLYLTTSSSRRSTGTHYTPIQYTRAMVKETLDPLVYVGEHGKLEEPLRLRSPREILDLKVCDPAMGSGAFLVQVIRYLGEKLADAWQVERERRGEKIPLYLPYAESAVDREDRIPLPEEREEAELWARRFVAERCVYGVDKNPLAVEMAKLSIWLVTLAKDKPFSFVDHALRPGDSLLGLSSLDQLRTWSVDGKSETQGLFEREIEKKLDEAVKLRRQIADFAVRTPADVARKEKQLAEANQATRGLWALADLLFATVLRSKKQAEQDVARTALLSEATHRLDDPEKLEELAKKELKGHAPLHWQLAFPEVFERETSGFDAFLGNPPYMGGRKIRSTLGESAIFSLLSAHPWVSANADLCAHFFLRTFRLLRPAGNFGLLATNSIAEGDTRQSGLEWLLRQDGVIYSAYPNERWPNRAAVFTSRVHMHKGSWQGNCCIVGAKVPSISAYLSAGEDWSPKRLSANTGVSFIGSFVLGMGFILSEEEALAMLDRSSRNRDVLYPYINGDDLNSHPEQRSNRWVINFWDWSEEKARSYAQPFEYIESRVRPERQRKRSDGSYALRHPLPDRWWHHADKRPALYHSIGRGQWFEKHPEGHSRQKPLPRVIVIARVSKTGAFALIQNSSIFSEQLVVVADDRLSTLALLQSNPHIEWAWQQSSKMKNDLRYAPSDCLETFPRPAGDASTSLDELGRQLDQLRAEAMRRYGIGLTGLYNLFHNAAEHRPDIVRLRELQTQIDLTVAAAYNWHDLDLQHDFHEVLYLPENDRIRFTVSEEARRKILDRLSQLNRERYEEEVAQGIHDKKKPTKGTRASKTSKSASSATAEPFAPPPQQTLFPMTDQIGLWEAPQPTSDPGSDSEAGSDDISRSASDLLAWLRKESDWRSRSEAVEALGLSTSEWNQAIQELLAAGFAERTGEKRETRYRAK